MTALVPPLEWFEFEDAEWAVPNDGFGVFDSIGEDFLRFRTAVEAFPAIRNAAGVSGAVEIGVF